MTRLVARCLVPFALLLATCSFVSAAEPQVVSAGGHFVIDDGEGHLLRGAALKGVVVRAMTDRGALLDVRIDAVESGLDADVELYALSARNAGSKGKWRPYCAKGQDGRERGFPIPADAANGSAGDFTIVCTAGAQGKCVMRGYRPWAVTAEGVSLAPVFEACVRMMRADYCGNGTSFTRAGIRVVAWDRVGINAYEDTPAVFEAAWGPDGPVCLTRARVPSIAPLEKVAAHCPRIAERIRDDCIDVSTRPGSTATIWNAVPHR